MAPEVLRNEPSNENSEINDVQAEIIKPDYQPRSDVFGFGVILWEPMTVPIPWIKLDSLEVAGVVGFMDRRLVLPESLDPMVATIISDCWRSYTSSDPEERPFRGDNSTND
ncbi:hypothetical protein POPTR_001G108900v4 [Populus trichocarpa]|uniref:Protein kinase domain-containing protein n=1 Tax=Populus trichocarpa TaxID=3694 RepID=A0A3N7EGY3_POPTR|nr:hypothetical protein BDE02_01G098200 [Populus trichocarpa]RQO84715.1 hypothetical protein POPTR_001G108900v4 [Populus trichocarpa]